MKFDVGVGKLASKIKCMGSFLGKIKRNKDVDHEF
jgi:hypothetical protein